MKSEVTTARARRRRTVLTYAKFQLDGGEPWGESWPLSGHSRSSLYICRKCRTEFHVDPELDPCAFCDSCKDAVLDMLAEALIKSAVSTPSMWRRRLHREVKRAMRTHGSVRAGAAALGMPKSTFHEYLRR